MDNLKTIFGEFILEVSKGHIEVESFIIIKY